MRKQITAAALTLALCGSLLAAPAQAAAFTPDNPSAGASSAAAAANAAGSTSEQVTAEKDLFPADAEGAVSFENLEKRVRENNAALLMLQETIETINAIDYEKLYDELREGMRAIAKAQWWILQAGNADSMLGMSGFTDSITSSYISSNLDTQYASLRETFEALKDGSLQEDNEAAVWQLEHTQNQVVMGAETLYIALLELQNTRSGLQRQLEALDRTVAEMELRYQYGQISALTLQQVKDGRTQLASGIATLDMNLTNLTCQLETMLGLSPTGTLVLQELPQVSDDQIAEMNYDAALAAAKEKSYELYNAQRTLDDAEETFRKDKTASGGLQSYAYKMALHTYNAAKYTHQSTVQNFELSFRTTYTAVADYQQVLAATESALDYQRASYAASELKYQQGSLSKNALLTAQDDLAAAENNVLTAKHNLFTAYHNYLWAVEHGILN